MKMVYLINKDGSPTGFMREVDHYHMSDDKEFEEDHQVAFVLDIEDNTPEIQESFFNKCKKILEFWRDNFEEIGTDVNKLYKIMVFK